LFADVGFERTTMRGVAARARVDPALIYHYFDGKEGLLAAVLVPPAAAAPLLAGFTGDPERAGEELVRRALQVWTEPGLREQAAAMLRIAMSQEHAAERFRNAHRAFVLRVVGDAVADDRRELRAALIGSPDRADAQPLRTEVPGSRGRNRRGTDRHRWSDHPALPHRGSLSAQPTSKALPSRQWALRRRSGHQQVDVAPDCTAMVSASTAAVARLSRG
jgi:AcrR family transcriptional regulator